MKKYLLGLFVFLAACTTQKVKETENIQPQESAVESALSTSSSVRSLKVKKIAPSGLVDLDHVYFHVFYDPTIRLPRYVTYELTKENLLKHKAKRHNKFRADPMLVEKGMPYVKPSEYLKSGYDQGHMAPYADFTQSQEASDETFVMSNMAPQKGDLNRHAWEKLETQVRKWACGEEKVTVITGPIVEADDKTLKSGLEIPDKFFKIIIDETPPRKVIGFIYSQKDTAKVDYTERIADVGDIEAQSGLSFKEKTEGIDYGLKTKANPTDWKTADCSAKKKKKRK